MKKRFALFMAVVLTLSTTAFSSVFAEAPADGIYVDNSYDDGKEHVLTEVSEFKVNNIAAGKSTKGVTDAPAGSKPGKVFLVETLPDGKTGPNINFDFSVNGKAGTIQGSEVPVLVIESNIWIENTAIRRGLFGLRDSLDYMPYLAVIDGGKFKLCDSLLKPIADSEFADCKENTWYHVLAKVDLNNRTYDFYIDGVLELDDQPLYKTADNEGEKGLFNKNIKFIRTELPDWDGFGGKTYFDDVKVYAETAAAAKPAPVVTAVSDLDNVNYKNGTVDFQFNTSVKKGALNDSSIVVTDGAGETVPYTASIVDSNYYRLSFDEGALEAGQTYNIRFSDEITDFFDQTLTGTTAFTMTAVNQSLTVTLDPSISRGYAKAGADVVLKAAASSSDADIASVTFYNGEEVLGEGQPGADGYTYTINAIPAGEYAISAVAADTDGATRRSAVVPLQAAEMENIIQDDFASGRDGWVIYNVEDSVSAVDVAQAPKGDYGDSLKLTVFAGKQKDPNANRTEFEKTPYTGVIQFKASIFTPTETKAFSGIEVKGQDSSGASKGSMLVKFEGGAVKNAQNASIGSYTPGEWVDVVAVWDTAGTSYTLWVDDTKYELAFSNALTNFNLFRLSLYAPANAETDTEGYFDNISVDRLLQRPQVAQVQFQDAGGSSTARDDGTVGAQTSKVLITFASEMNAATMTGDNIALSAGWQDIPVGTTGKYDAQSKTYTMTIDPGSLPLQRLEQYHIVVSKAVETVEEVAGGTDTVIDFTVEGGPLYANIADVTVDGGPAGSLQAGDTVSIRAAVHKNDTATPEVTLALAVYAGQKLIAVELESVQMSSAEQERAIEADILLPQEFQPGDTVKAFVWNVRNGLTPISNTAVLE